MVFLELLFIAVTAQLVQGAFALWLLHRCRPVDGAAVQRGQSSL